MPVCRRPGAPCTLLQDGISLLSDFGPAPKNIRLGAPQIVDRDEAGIKYTCRPIPQGAPEV
jgi:hypothetical protein